MKNYTLKCDQCQMHLYVESQNLYEASQIVLKEGWVITNSHPLEKKIAENIKFQALCPAHNPNRKRTMWAPPRFRSMEDAIVCTRAMNESGGIPQDRMVLPYKQLPNGDAIINPEWESCPLEVYYSIVPARTIENVPNNDQ